MCKTVVSTGAIGDPLYQMEMAVVVVVVGQNQNTEYSVCCCVVAVDRLAECNCVVR